MTFEFWTKTFWDRNEVFAVESPIMIVEAATLDEAVPKATDWLYAHGIIYGDVTLISHCVDDDAWNMVNVVRAFAIESVTPTTRSTGFSRDATQRTV